MPTVSGSGRLHDRIAVVTGASSSIGRAIAIAYADEGAKVVIADIRPTSRAEIESTATHEVIKQRGGEAKFVNVDVTDTASVEDLIKETVKAYGRLDIMVNNAGIATETANPEPIYELSDKIWHSTLAVNATGVMHGIRAASRQMMKQDPVPGSVNGDRGWIINLASMYGLIGVAGAPSYASSKHLSLGLTKSSALDLAPHSIHVNAICPGFVDTPLTAQMWAEDQPAESRAGPMADMSGPERKAMVGSMHPFGGPGGRLGTPGDVAGVAVFLASGDARWMTGAGVVCDGGFSIQ
ncbi:MAG: hypothetical protein M1828_001176 [Chrysothrix sp. TS-e1954]|nr:MAG: hypothetical protein M1828_001176 [Chrysothrix sp. TS-e1954]